MNKSYFIEFIKIFYEFSLYLTKNTEGLFRTRHFSTYVFLLFAVNYQSFESSWLSENLNMDKAILQSFVTFIAFDRALTVLKDLEFKPSDLLRIIVNSFLTNWQKTKEEKKVFNT